MFPKETMKYPEHEAAALFPLLEGADLQELAADIAERGLLEPITLLGGAVLDGRNRLRACALAKVEPRFTDWAGTGSPLAWVISKNVKRRHLTPSQRATVAVESLPMFEREAKERQRAHAGTAPGKAAGSNTPSTIGGSVSEKGEATAHAAKAAGASRAYVADAKAIQEDDPKAFAEVKAGKRTISDVQREHKRKKRVEKLNAISAAPGVVCVRAEVDRESQGERDEGQRKPGRIPSDSCAERDLSDPQRCRPHRGSARETTSSNGDRRARLEVGRLTR